MPKDVTMPDWLQGLINQVAECENWPNDKYPALAMEARDRIGEYGGDEDWQAALLQLVIDEVERLRAELDAERHEEKCFETSFLNVCLYAEIDAGQSREVMEEELVSLVKAAKAAGGE